MTNRVLYLDLGLVYFAEDTVRLADPKLIAFAWEVDYAQCNFFRGMELFIVDRHRRNLKSDQAIHLSFRMIEPFEYLQRVLHLLYPFLEEA